MMFTQSFMKIHQVASGRQTCRWTHIWRKDRCTEIYLSLCWESRL